MRGADRVDAFMGTASWTVTTYAAKTASASIHAIRIETHFMSPLPGRASGAMRVTHLNIDKMHIISNPTKWMDISISGGLRIGNYFYLIDMIENNVNYYCDASLQKTDDEKWLFLLRMVLYDSDFVEFNIFKKGFDKIPEIESISKHIIDTAKPKQKIYPRDKFLRYVLHENVKKFILSKQYKYWKNFYLEDISFFKDEMEIFATITHENYIIMLLNEAQYNDLNSKGYNFIYFLPANFSIRSK